MSTKSMWRQPILVAAILVVLHPLQAAAQTAPEGTDNGGTWRTAGRAKSFDGASSLGGAALGREGDTGDLQHRHSTLKGLAAGAGAGALFGFVIAPATLCHRDPECSAIVDVAVGLPSVGGGALIGALIGHFAGSRPSRTDHLRALQLAPMLGKGVRGVRGYVRF